MLHVYGPLRPSWTASYAGTGTLGAVKGAPQLDRLQSWDRNAGSRQRSLPVGPPAELGQERWEATQEGTVAESSGAAPRLGRPRVRRAVCRAARLRAARRAPTLPSLLHGEQERRPRRGESHLSAAVACGRSSALVWGRACVLVAAGTAARPCSERHHRRDLRPHHRVRRMRRALQAPEFDQRQLSNMMESFSQLEAPRRNQLSSLPERSWLRAAP